MWRKPSFFAQPLEQGFHPYAKYEQKINPLFGGPSGIGGFFRRNEFESRQYFTSWNIMQYYMLLLKEKHLVEKEFSPKNSYFLTWLSSKIDLVASWKSWIVPVVVRFMKPWNSIMIAKYQRTVTIYVRNCACNVGSQL